MLKHEDHIFTNLNGYNSFKLKEAKSRGCWNNTKKIIQRGSSWAINEIRLSDLRGRGGAGFSHTPLGYVTRATCRRGDFGLGGSAQS